MYRIARHADDGSVTFTEYETRHRSEATGRLALRFDSELMALKQQGITLGVKRWTEAVFKMDQFGFELREKLDQLQRDLADVRRQMLPEDSAEEPTEEQAQAYTEACEKLTTAYGEWQSGHPALFLTQAMGVWLSINMGGDRATLLDVLDIAEQDISEEMDDLPYIPEDESDEAEDASGES